MIARSLLEAIGQIDDKYVMEFAYVHKPKFRWQTVAAIAACLIIIIGTILTLNRFTSVQSKPSVVWASSDTDNETIQFGVIKGSIQYSNSLSKALISTENESAVFAIKVIELTGVSKDEVYHSFIIPHKLAESYMNNNIIYVSREQLSTMICPKNMSIVLTLAPQSEQEVLQ